MQTTQTQPVTRGASLRKKTSARSNSLLKRMRDNWMFYVSVAPFFILFALFGAIPIVASFYLGFTQWDGLSQPIFIGLANYSGIFRDPDFFKVLYNTLYIWIGSTVATLGLAFVLAFMVNHYVTHAHTFFRVVFLFPLLVAPALTAIIVSVLFSTNAGLVNTLISIVVAHKFTYDWFVSGQWLKPLVILMIVWRWTGWHFILFLSGLQTIPREIYESARVDGAKGRHIIRFITLPLMVPVLLVSVVTSTIGGLQIFDEPYVLTNGSGGTGQAATTLGLYQYQAAFQDFQFGMASAISYVIFALIVIFSIINFRVLRNRT